jgi:hypothetical protein
MKNLSLFEITHNPKTVFINLEQSSYYDNMVYFIPKEVASPEDIESACKDTIHNPAGYTFKEKTTEGCFIEYSYSIGD